jgi:hypothetical protein
MASNANVVKRVLAVLLRRAVGHPVEGSEFGRGRVRRHGSFRTGSSSPPSPFPLACACVSVLAGVLSAGCCGLPHGPARPVNDTGLLVYEGRYYVRTASHGVEPLAYVSEDGDLVTYGDICRGEADERRAKQDTKNWQRYQADHAHRMEAAHPNQAETPQP